MGRGEKHSASRAKGASGFESHFEELFQDRWPSLKESLRRDPAYTALERGLRKPYYLDRASLIPARALPVEGAREIVDLCAAPGGKTIELARRSPPGALLRANDRSRARLRRLRRVLEDHLPPDLLDRVETSGHDAALWGSHRPESADAVLCDVPCSSERHVLSSPTHLEQWSESRITRLSKQAIGILASAFDTVKTGGVLVYATCALSPAENDRVVHRLIERRGARAVLETPSPEELEQLCSGILPIEALEATEHGYQILPDRADGAGPIYFSRLRKADQL